MLYTKVLPFMSSDNFRKNCNKNRVFALWNQQEATRNQKKKLITYYTRCEKKLNSTTKYSIYIVSVGTYRVS